MESSGRSVVADSSSRSVVRQSSGVTVPVLDYGTICAPPPAVAAAAKANQEKQRAATVEKVLKYNQDLASRGDAYGQLRMGERYRDGDGVEKDLVKARDYFQKAAAQGNVQAAEMLKNLPQ